MNQPIKNIDLSENYLLTTQKDQILLFDYRQMSNPLISLQNGQNFQKSKLSHQDYGQFYIQTENSCSLDVYDIDSNTVIHQISKDNNRKIFDFDIHYQQDECVILTQDQNKSSIDIINVKKDKSKFEDQIQFGSAFDRLMFNESSNKAYLFSNDKISLYQYSNEQEFQQIQSKLVSLVS